MGKAERKKNNIDPTWPAGEDHPVTELASDRQGSLSPYGDVTFPVQETPYQHPSTEINWTD